MLIRTPIPNMLGGVSQQPDSLRKPNQCELQENAWPSPVDGLTRRHPTEHLAKIDSGSLSSTRLIHPINRSDTERYVTVVEAGGIRVFDGFTGAEIPVKGPTAPYDPDFSYISDRTANPVEDPETMDSSGSTWVRSGSADPEVITTDDGPLVADLPGTVAVDMPLITPGTSSGAWRESLGAIFGTLNNFSFYVRKPPAGGPFADRGRVTLIDATNALFYFVKFDINVTTGVVTLNPPHSHANVIAGLEDVGGGWYRVSVGVDLGTIGTATAVGDSAEVEIQVGDSGGPTTGVSYYAWGALYSNSQTTAPPYAGLVGRLRALTVADTTFVLNGRKQVEMGSTQSSAQPHTDAALVFVKQGGLADTHYEVEFKLMGAGGSTVVEYTTSADLVTTPDAQSDDDIAAALQTGLGAITDVTANRQGSVIHVFSDADTIDVLEGSDSRGDTLMTVVRESGPVRSIADLPLIAPNGFKVKVAGARDGSTLDDFYLQFSTDNGATFGKGQWSETVKREIDVELNAATMPHKLVRTQDDSAGTVTGTPDQIYFEFDSINWTNRQVGDVVTNPNPSFVNFAISNLFFFKGRLGLLSDLNVIMSETNSFFNFFRSTVRTVVDSDPVDVSASHSRVSKMRAAIPFNEQLVLYSERTQFVLQGEPLVAPGKTSITPVLEFEHFDDVDPVSNGRSMYFGFKQGDFTGVREMFRESEVTFDTENITQAVPKYLEGALTTLSASRLVDVVTATTTGSNRNDLWVYHYSWDGRTRVQSAWSRYDFGSQTQIKGQVWIESTLYLVLERNSETFLEKMEVADGQVDDGSDYITHLDRRLADDFTGVSRVYDAADDETTITIPYEVLTGEDTVVITRGESGDTGGELLIVLSATPGAPAAGQSEVVVLGDHTAEDLWIGQAYQSRYQLSRAYLKERTSQGGLVTYASSLNAEEHTVLWLTLVFEDTGTFDVRVNAVGRGSRLNTYAGKRLGYTLGSLQLAKGRVRFPVFSRVNSFSAIIESSSPLPFKITSGEWEANLRQKTQRFGDV